MSAKVSLFIWFHEPKVENDAFYGRKPQAVPLYSGGNVAFEQKGHICFVENEIFTKLYHFSEEIASKDFTKVLKACIMPEGALYGAPYVHMAKIPHTLCNGGILDETDYLHPLGRGTADRNDSGHGDRSC